MSQVNEHVSGGLTAVEAARRRAAIGPNTIEDESWHPVRRALSKLWSPIPWMLEAAILLQLVFGEFVEAAVVAALLVFNGALGFVQESRAQVTLRALKSRLALTAPTFRDGVWAVLPASDLVPGDLIMLSLGAIVAADVHLVDGSVLVDQSMLTGESIGTEAGPGDEVFAGALIRRGEAIAEVIATGGNTRFGRGAELIRTAHVDSTQQKAILRVVRNLAFFNGGVTVLLTAYAFALRLPISQIAPLVLVALLASIPVALPSMFTLAATIGARHLASQGVLPTRLASLDEAAGVDVLCADKTGTLTLNSLTVGVSHPAHDFSDSQVLSFAALASSVGGADPVDLAVREAAAKVVPSDFKLVSFEPFDPAVKMSTATVATPDGTVSTVAKGAYAVIAELTRDSSEATEAHALETHGFRVLAVGVGTMGAMKLAGLIALSDPPRPDSRALVEHLAELGVRTVMVTGDAVGTAETIAREVGIEGSLSETASVGETVDLESIGVFAGVLPEDKFALVKALRGRGHIVAVCGDGVNDAPALRQAQLGVAVLTATDVAKSAAGVVLTSPRMSGIVATIEEGRSTFQRILTYTLRSLVPKVVQVLFLLAGLIISGHPILTPVLMVLMMVAGDFLAMSSSTDNVRPSTRPNVWRIGNLTLAAILLGLCDLAFCVTSLVVGRVLLRFDARTLPTLAVVTLVFSGQAVFYVARERLHLWASRPSRWMIVSSIIDLGAIACLASLGILMAPISVTVIAGVALAAVGLAILLDFAKVALFRRLAIA